jgi:putative transposase
MHGKIKEEVESCIRSQSVQMTSEVMELNIQVDHIHMIALIPPKLSVSEYMGRVKGKTALRLFTVFRDLRRMKYWGNHFWAPGYCVGTVGLDEEKIRKYVKYQEEQELKQEELRFGK